MTKKEYAEYTKKFDAFMESHKATDFSTKPEETYHETHCEICRLFATCEEATLFNELEYVDDIVVCHDCVYYMEYGQLDDMTMMDIEDSQD